MSYYASNVTVGTAPRLAGFLVTQQRDELTANESTSSGTLTDTALTVTLPNRTGGKDMASFAGSVFGSLTSQHTATFAFHDGAVIPGSQVSARNAQDFPCSVHYIGPLDGSTLKIQWKVSSSSMTVFGTLTDEHAHMEIIEIGGK